ncbi:hypothetical protein AAFF_G00274260 [Aldrovandia affinis]|uniref:Uncharacterized protein n=1 Tax=Aldrovandia affinis TaxID=143900 RepID=A0AAD7SRM7_9TELE|nr:hypothetical protein AAFF_G00274260 [Aldrovandia affinis]
MYHTEAFVRNLLSHLFETWKLRVNGLPSRLFVCFRLRLSAARGPPDADTRNARRAATSRPHAVTTLPRELNETLGGAGSNGTRQREIQRHPHTVTPLSSQRTPVNPRRLGGEEDPLAFRTEPTEKESRPHSTNPEFHNHFDPGKP